MSDTQGNAETCGYAAGKTQLHHRHTALGAAMAPFAGWDMPLWYKTGAVKEHLAVVTGAGLFDTSHMDVIMASGPKTTQVLDFAFTRNVVNAKPGRAIYGAFLNENGFCIDDGIVYPFPDGRMAVVVNANMGRAIATHVGGMAKRDEIAIARPEPRFGKLDLQGPASAIVIRRVLADPDTVLAKFPYFTFKGDFDFSRSDVFLKRGIPVLLSRTGYTGELGFEIFVPGDRVEEAWDMLLDAGAPEGIVPCGLAARDSLRTGAVLPLSHQDIGAWPFINNPWMFALPYDPETNSMTKVFLGGVALNPITAQYTLPFVGSDQRRVDRESAEVLYRDERIGSVLTIVSDMAIGRVDGVIKSIASPDRPDGWQPRGLACGFVKVDRNLAPGEIIALKDKRREIKVEITDNIRPDRTARRKINYTTGT